MSLQEKYDEIYDSLVNGQRRQSVKQAEDMGLDNVPGMLDYFVKDLNQPELAIDFAKTYFLIRSR